jgi:anti-sigma-K factor RskA
MILQCGDLDRALRTPELMPDMRAHAERCQACAEQLHLWNEISRVAPQLREEWESPFLWQRIQANLKAEAPRRQSVWRWAPAAAAVIALGIFMLHPWRAGAPANRELMTESALSEVQRAETAYAKSIEKLSAVAATQLEASSSPLAAAYREKLALLDSAIADLNAGVSANRYNAYLRTELASLYRQKQTTLQDWLQNANRN